DLSGLESVPVASGVQIIGDRSVVPVGPRLYTRTFPHTLLQIGNDDSHNPGTSDGVRISGIRLDGGMGDDPWSAVGKDDADGIGVFSSQHVEIDHNELYGWRGSAVNVHDGQNLVNQDNASTVWIHDNYIHHNQHPSADTCVDSLI